jgi:DNA-binding MurR/RpiR family transcriptional regulator
MDKLGQRVSAAQGELRPGEGAAEASLAAAGLHLQALGDPSTAEAVARGLAGAPQVWVRAFGLSAHLAAMLVLELQPCRDGVVNKVQFGGTKAAARLTDSNASALARSADDLLLAPAQHPVLPSSSLPGLAVIGALVSEFLLLDPRHPERAERQAASTAAYLALE